jgi:hypothetical protein
MTASANHASVAAKRPAAHHGSNPWSTARAGALLTTTTGSTHTKTALARPLKACLGSRENSMRVK